MPADPDNDPIPSAEVPSQQSGSGTGHAGSRNQHHVAFCFSRRGQRECQQRESLERGDPAEMLCSVVHDQKKINLCLLNRA
jgi:hypothetical protein